MPVHAFFNKKVSGFFTVAIGSLFFFPSPVFAQSTLRAKLPTSPWAFDGELRLEHLNYPTSIPESPQLNQSNLLSARLQATYQSSFLKNKADVVLGRYLNSNVNEAGVYELYVSRNTSSANLQWAVGRKKEHWNQVDSDFNLGLWQPNWAIDTLRTEEQGLSGIFLKDSFGPLQAMALVSPWFVPTMGPALQQDSGKLEPVNRWVRAPSNLSKIRNRTLPLVYSLDVPDYSDLVNKPGVGARIQVGSQLTGPWASVGYAHKPVNGLMLKYNSSLVLSESAGTTGEAVISPVVGYHDLYSAEFGWSKMEWNFSLSAARDQPKEVAVEGEFIQQKLEPISVVGAHFEREISVFKRSFQTTISYMKAQGGEIRDFDSAGVAQGALFDSRLLYTNALLFSADTEVVVFAKPVRLKVKYLREWDQQGSIISIESQMTLAKKMRAVLGIDVLGPDSLDDKESDTRFINQFRANDRLFAGVSYVF